MDIDWRVQRGRGNQGKPHPQVPHHELAEIGLPCSWWLLLLNRPAALIFKRKRSRILCLEECFTLPRFPLF